MDNKLPSLWYCAILLLATTTTITFCSSTTSTVPSKDARRPVDDPTATLSTSWINKIDYVYSPSAPSFSYSSFDVYYGSSFNTVLGGSNGSQFVCGFFCPYDNKPSTLCLLGVFIFQNISGYSINNPLLVWTANRDLPVHINATLQLTGDGDLRLADADGTLVWSTNTAGKSVSGLKLTQSGNLLLFDNKNETVWQSFDYPTDTLVLGQKLVPGQELTSSVSASNWSRGLYSISFFNGSWVLSVDSNLPQYYFNLGPQTYLQLANGSFSDYPITSASGAQVITLEPNGHLNVYGLGGGGDVVADLLTPYIFDGECGYPMVCGKYGLCSSSNGQCSCPEEVSANGTVTSYFGQTVYGQPNLGCSLIEPISCDQSQYHSLLELNITTGFQFQFALNSGTGIQLAELEDCKSSCLRNCSCKAALFGDTSFGYPMFPPIVPLAPASPPETSAPAAQYGSCLLLVEVLSLVNVNGSGYASELLSTYVKVQKSPTASYNIPPPTELVPPPMDSPQKKSKRVKIILGCSLGASFFGVFLVVASYFVLFGKKREPEDIDEFTFDQVLQGMPTRFSYADLKAVTNDFSNKLGEGGFGSVFEGTLSNGTKIAVKRLDGLGHVRKSFLAEVETIGNIHHVNLVRLVGFCAEKSQRLLVYEYMCNGSLDKWIFHRHHESTLGWQCRRSIILDVAKGLAYLHEECRQKIFHLDVKPQNILVDENFNAKVADFGLAKLINKDQSKVAATMRGTPGYMAPEWLSSVITEKVDVYSFGVVVLEILCGRRNVDRSHPEEDMHLLGLFERKAEENRLLNLVDKHNDDMQLHGAEVVEMMRIAAWCLQSHFARRPAMSVVVKVLEGSMECEANLDYKFTYPAVQKTLAALNNNNSDGASVDAAPATLLFPSVLSAPR